MNDRDHPEGQDRRRFERGRLDRIKNYLYRFLRFIGRHVQSFFGALAAYFSAGFALGAVAVLVFAGLGRVVSAGVTRALDRTILRWFNAQRTSWLDQVMVQATDLGDTSVIFVMLAVASIFLWLTKHHYSVYLLAFAFFGGRILTALLKNLYNRPRPQVIDRLTQVTSESFPSGHAMTSMIAYGSVAYLVGRLEPTHTERVTTYTLAGLVILAVGVSRVYLGVHYPSDVIAGWLAGLAWIAIVAAGMTAIRFFEPRRPQIEEEERGLHAEEEHRMAHQE